jgi:hypothetical protein
VEGLVVDTLDAGEHPRQAISEGAAARPDPLEKFRRAVVPLWPDGGNLGGECCPTRFRGYLWQGDLPSEIPAENVTGPRRPPRMSMNLVQGSGALRESDRLERPVRLRRQFRLGRP